MAGDGPTVPTLDGLAQDPAQVAALAPDTRQILTLRALTVLAALAAVPPAPNGRPPEAPAEDRPLTVPEVAARLQVGKAYVYDLIRRGEIAAIRFGKYVRVAPPALREWEARHQEKALDRGQYKMYSSPPGGQQRERRRPAAHPRQARSDSGSTR